MAKPKRRRQLQVRLVSRCFIKRGDRRLLIIRRPKNGSRHSGKWEVPGGKVEKGQNLIETRYREAQEETGLRTKATRHPVLVDDSAKAKHRKKPLRKVYFSITRVAGGVFLLSDEHIDYRWVMYHQMLRYNLTPQVRLAALMFEKYLRS